MNDKPAFPNIHPHAVSAVGISRRELFAAMAMQSLILERNSDGDALLSPSEAGEIACSYADALSIELDK